MPGLFPTKFPAAAPKKSPVKIPVKIPIPDIPAELGIDPGAQALVEMDLAIQKWTKDIDKQAAKAIKKIAPRNSKSIVTVCEQIQSALPVSTSLKAIHFGTLKIVFRVLPRMFEKFLTKEFEQITGKIAVRVAAKKLVGFVPLLGSILSAGVGVYTQTQFMNELESEIHAALGCVPNIFEKKPMRWALNEIVRKNKIKAANEPRPKDKVHTRKTGAGSSAGGDF